MKLTPEIKALIEAVVPHALETAMRVAQENAQKAVEEKKKPTTTFEERREAAAKIKAKHDGELSE
jgi:hypothetical protein